jgi:hypothetical protein
MSMLARAVSHELITYFEALPGFALSFLPSAIADAFWSLAHQDRSVWSHELDIRPFKKKVLT